jgi:hypothetical protein
LFCAQADAPPARGPANSSAGEGTEAREGVVAGGDSGAAPPAASAAAPAPSSNHVLPETASTSAPPAAEGLPQPAAAAAKEDTTTAVVAPTASAVSSDVPAAAGAGAAGAAAAGGSIGIDYSAWSHPALDPVPGPGQQTLQLPSDRFYAGEVVDGQAQGVGVCLKKFREKPQLWQVRPGSPDHTTHMECPRSRTIYVLSPLFSLSFLLSLSRFLTCRSVCFLLIIVFRVECSRMASCMGLVVEK